MAVTEYTYQEKEQILEQFRLLPQPMQSEFVGKISNNHEMASNANLLASEMQGLINRHVAMQAAEVHPFAALLVGNEKVLASFASMQGDSQSVNLANSGQLGTQLASQTEQRGLGDPFSVA